MKPDRGFDKYSILLVLFCICNFGSRTNAELSTTLTLIPLGEHTTEIMLAFTANSVPTCLLDFGNGETSTITVSDYNLGKTLLHTHDTNGFYDFYTFCLTEDEIDEKEGLGTYVGDFVSGFEVNNAQEGVIKVFAPIAADVEIDLWIENGTDTNLTAILLHNNEEIEIVTASVGESNLMTFPQSNFPASGLYTVQVAAVNPITPKNELDIIIAIQEDIVVSLVKINGGTNNVEVLAPFDIESLLSSGEDVTVTYDILNEAGTTVDSLAFVCEGLVRDHKHTYQINTTGTFSVVVEISNMVASYSDTFTVVSMYAVNSLEFDVSQQIAMYTDAVQFSLVSTGTLSENSPAGVVTCLLDFGDTNTDSVILDLTMLTPAPVSDLKLKTYEAGFYKPVMTCTNDIPTELKFEFDLRIENPVENIHLENSTDNVPMSVGISVYVKLDNSAVLPLHLINCSFDFNDGSAPKDVLGNITSDSFIESFHQYSQLGSFTINVNCSAYLTHHVMSIEVQTYWDCWQNTLFFESFKDEVSPMVFMAHEPLKLQGVVTLTQTCRSHFDSLEYVWTILGPLPDDANEEHSATNKLLTYNVPEKTLNKGKYKVVLASVFTNLVDAVQEDFMYIESKLPDLVPIIEGSTDQIVQFGENILIDASNSFDPADGLSEVDSEFLDIQWSCRMNPGLTDDDVSLFFASGNTDLSTIAVDDCGISLIPGSYFQTFQTDAIQDAEDVWHIFQLTMTRGDRTKSAFQALKPVYGDPLSLNLNCIANCHDKSVTDKNKIGLDTLQLRVIVLDEDINPKEVNFTWHVHKFVEGAFVDLSNMLTAAEDRDIAVPTSILEKGESYRVSCDVKAPARRITTASETYFVNLPPYNGDCSIDRTTGKSGLDEFCVTCQDWLDEDNRESPSAEDNPGSLIYDFIQINDGAPVSEIIYKSSNQMKYCMDLALPRNDTNVSIVMVKIKDKYLRPETTKSFTVTVLPAFDVSRISDTGGSEGAAEIQSFTDVQQSKMESALASGDTEKLSSTVTTVMSNLADIKVEAPPPAVSEDVADDGGGMIDMAEFANGTSRIITSEDVLADFNAPPVLDETTAQLQNSLETYTDLMTSAMQKTLVSPNTTVSPVEVSQNAKAFTAILSTSRQNIKPSTKKTIADNIGKMSELLVNGKVSSDNADTHSTRRDIQKLEGSLISAVVPPELKKVKPVTDMASADLLTQALFDLADEETRALREEADMSVVERNFALYKTQLKIKNEIQKTVDAEEAQKAAKAFAELSDAIQQSLRQGDGYKELLGEAEETIVQMVTKNRASKMAETPLTTNLSSVEIPELGNFVEDSVVASITESKENVYLYDADLASSRVTSPVSRLKVDMSGTLRGRVKVKTNVNIPPYKRLVPIVDPEDASQLSYYKTFVQSAEDLLCIRCIPTSDIIDKYEILINYGKNPTNRDKVAMEEASAGNFWSGCFASQQRPGREIGNWHFGVRSVLNGNHASSRRRREASNDTEASNSSLPAFDMATATMACMTWDSDSNSWKSDACDAKWKPDEGILECSCSPTNNELTFANSFYVPPNTIDFSTVFLKFSPLNQAAVMAVLAIVFVIYILIVIWARRQDKKDLLKWGITPLVDNFPEDCYFYVVKVYTGMRPGAGTKSKVAFVLAGDEMDTGVRELSDGVRKDFRTGSILNFLMSTNTALGQLEYLRIWHDNSGGGSDSSWYLSKIEVQDVQLNETFIFQAERWLAVEREDGALECVVPVSKRNDLNVFRNRFYQNAKDNLAENHVWISVVYRPSSSTFTRVQRTTCALVFVMLAMIANAMFFRSEDNYETASVVRVGPFRFSLQQIYISIISALISTPPTILIIYLFKMSKRNLPRHSENLYRPRRARKYTLPFWDDWRDNKIQESMKFERHLVAKGYPQLQGCYLPYWCNYIAWFLAFAAVVLSAFFVMLYSMEWGKQKSEEWLTTFLLSFFESVLCLDPIKVAMMALLFALLFRATKDSAAMIERKTIMKQYSASLRGQSSGIRLPAPPLDDRRLDEARAIRKKELMMKNALQNVIVNLFICWILFSISYSNRDNRSFYLHRDVHKQILAPKGSPQFMDIRSTNTFYEWLNKSAILRLFPEYDLNGDRLHWRQRQFMFGGASFRLGPPRLRQLRVKKEACPITDISTKNCYSKYNIHEEETGSYCIGWVSGTCDPNEEIYKYSSPAWKFTSALDIWGLPASGYYTTYGGGGYIALLDVNRDVSQYIVNELYESSWVDRQTRAVILEFTLYCLNTNIFMYNMFMVEFPETGGAFPFHVLLPLRVYHHSGPTGIYTLACEIIFVIFLLVLTVQMVINMVQQKCQFFKKPWQVLDMVIIILGYAAIVMYGIRFAMTAETIEKFRNDKKQFVNFYHIALWDQLLILLIGTLDFIVTIRLLNILGYNKRINAVAQVFTTAASDLLWFGIFFANIFTCYAVFGYLLFGSKLKSYMNVYATMGTLFISMIGKSRFTEIDDTDPVMSKIYFMIFIFFVVYCILTMFLAVLSKSIENVHSNLKEDKGEEMVDYLVNKFKNLIGYGLGDRKTANRRSNPPAPWNPDARRMSQLDNRSILQAIRTSLHEALKENNEESSSESGFKQTRKRKK